ncbi:MAG: M48 family metallopeptidase [Bacteroidota bacterium]
MNIYGWIVLAAIVTGFLLDTIADYLNLKNLNKGLPREFSDLFDEEKYRESQNYTKERTKFGYYPAVLSLVITLAFWFAGGFEWLDSLVVSLNDSFIIRGLLFIGILGFAQMLISLPFSIYSTFVIEEKYGFNKTTPKVFVIDRLKSTGLSVLIGAPLLAGLLWVLRETGEYAWLYGWAGLVVFMLIMQYIAPRWIMPLFNKFKPLEEGELRDKIFSYAEKVNFPLTNVFVMDGSKRSTKSNAFFTGFGKNKRIALYDTLIEKHTDDELVAVLAHEIGHYKKKHITAGMLISIAHTGILFYLLSIFLYDEGLYRAFFMDRTPIYAGLVFFGMLYSPVEMILSVLMNIFSRKNEYQADRFAAETYEKPRALIDALKKLSKNNLSNLTPHQFYVFINYSHPPVLKRIKKIDHIAQGN